MQRRKPPAVRVGYDLTLTTEKSLGILALLSDQPTGRHVLDAIEAGNDWALNWLETHTAAARIRGKPVRAAGWTVASFRHLTSRALDPFPHHHNVIANTVMLSDGTHRALDARGLYRDAQAASALATAEMRHHLTSRLGVRWRPGRNGGWEVDGIPDTALTEFSQRRNEIDEALAELEEAIGTGAHPAQIEDIVLRTRPPKKPTSHAALAHGWRQRATAVGLDSAAIAACYGSPRTPEEPDPHAVFAALAGSDGICASGSVFTRADVLAAICNAALPANDPNASAQPFLGGARALQQQTDGFLASPHVVRLTTGSEPLYTTAEMLGLQRRIVRRVRGGLNRGAALVAPTTIEQVFDRHPHLTSEQQALVRSWCQGGHRYQAAIGRAGSGKTTTVAAAAEAWRASGYRVVGAAVKGEAARTLATSASIECETVAWYLAHQDPGRLPLDARTVLIVDEASTISDRDLDHLMSMTANAGATLRLVGDPAQHGAVAAGGMYRVLCDEFQQHTPELTVTHRLRHPDDRAAAEALRNGRIDDALDQLQRAGHLHVMPDELAMYRDILARWWDAHLARQPHPMVDRRNRTRRQLNRLAHTLLRANGELGPDELIASDDRRFSPGDRVAARLPDRTLHADGDRRAYVRNGATGTVTAIHKHPSDHTMDALQVDFDGLGVIRVPRSFFDHHRRKGGRVEPGLDHAYALTSYAVQGATSDVSTSRIDPTTTRAEAYVDITRGRLANHLYITGTTPALDDEELPALPSLPPDEQVAHRLKRSRPELTAWELAERDDCGATRRVGLSL